MKDAESRYQEQGFGLREIGLGERPALLMVDMQRDFVDPEAPTTCAPMAQERLPAIRALLDAARDAGIPVFFSRGLVRPDLSDVGLWKGPHGEGRVQVEGTPGAEIVPELAPGPTETVIEKRRPSAFFHTDLDLHLRELEVDTLILAGSSMSGCVRATAVDAFSRDYRTIVVRDCVIDRSLAALEASLLDISAKYADTMDHDWVVSHLRSVRNGVQRKREASAAPEPPAVEPLRPEVAREAGRALQARFDAVVRDPNVPMEWERVRDGLRRFLAEHLPASRFRLSEGTVFDSWGNSLSTDALIVADASGAPFLPLSERQELLPAEAVFASVHPVPRLRQEELGRLVAEVAEIKSLHREPVVRGDERVNDCASMILAFEGIADAELLVALAEANASIPFERQVDVVAVLGRGVATFVEMDPDGSVTVELPLRPSPRHRLCWIDSADATLLVVHLLLWETLRGRSLRWPPLHSVLRLLSDGPTRTLTTAHGADRGE
ncbi:MAG: isochorismatase family protein [Actinomycetota bacterium]